jgi:DNA-binding NarL/FixJ family response regulator
VVNEFEPDMQYSRHFPASDGAHETGAALQSFNKLFMGGEARFLMACLSRDFNPSFIYVGTSNMEFALAYKSIKVTSDFLGAAASSAQAIELLKSNNPGFVFIHERDDLPQYSELLEYISQAPQAVKSFVLIDSLELLAKLAKIDADVIVADRDIFLPVNPLAQGLMAMVAGTTYRSPSIASCLNTFSPTIDPQSSRRITLGLRDQQLLEAYVLGLSNREIAEQLNLSVRSVQTYSGNLLSRLGVNNRQKALLSIAKMGISVVPKFFQW